ncbi:MAG: CPBP family intramembrane metalloprotease [Candidatus Pacebacteria bacterium]|nr:CPBP family intramembrane metalloprotease [Candidatus Paceibacterota bacterium]
MKVLSVSNKRQRVRQKSFSQSFETFFPLLLLILLPLLILEGLPFFKLRIVLVLLTMAAIAGLTIAKLGKLKVFFSRPGKPDLIFLIPVVVISLIVLSEKISLPISCNELTIIFKLKIPFWQQALIYICLSTFLQELIYRLFLFNFLKTHFGNPGSFLIWGTFLFAWLHLAWGPGLSFGSLFFGLYLNWWFVKTNNFWGVFLAHACLGTALSGACYL